MIVATLSLFAQKGGGGGDGDAGGLCCCGVVIAIIAVGLVIHIMYLLAVSRCIAQISPRNQPMSPGMVWLALIPLFGGIWQIIMMFQLADALQKEYRTRGMRGDGDFGKTATIIYLIGFAVGIMFLVGWIMHWVKVSGYTQELMRTRHGEYDDYEDGDDDYDDDRPRRRRDRDDDDDDDRGGRPWDRGAR